MNQAWAAAWVAKSPQFITSPGFSSGAVAGDAVMVGAGASEVVEGGAVVGGAVVGVGVVAVCVAASKQPESTDSIAVFSAWSMLSSHRAFTATQLATYSHRYPTAGGSHSAGSRSPFERFEDADTAISVSGDASSFANASRREELQLFAPESCFCSGTGGRYRTTGGSLLLFHRRLKAIGHWLAGSHRSFPRARATLRRGLRIGCCNGRRRDQTSGRTGHGHSRHAVARLQQEVSQAAPVFRTLLALLRGRVLRQADRSGRQ